LRPASTSPTGEAVIACVNDAYTIGQAFSSQGQSPDAQSQLSTGLGIYQGNKECAEKVSDAQHADQALHETPTVTLNEIQTETHVDDEWQDTDNLVDEALRFVEDGLKVHD
jgi:hypothetical protein